MFLGTVTVNVGELVGGTVTLLVLRLAVGPLIDALEVRVMVPLKLARAVTDIVLVPDEPEAMSR
jgi:hypothetical protein